MASMTISVPEAMRDFIESRLESEGFASASAYVESLIREAQGRQAKRELEARLEAAVASGPAVEMTRQDWDSIEGEALGGLPPGSIAP